MNRSWRSGQSGNPSGHGSMFEWWFAERTKPPSCGRCSSPFLRNLNTCRIGPRETAPMKWYMRDFTVGEYPSPEQGVVDTLRYGVPR